jgi:hypothetical protein
MRIQDLFTSHTHYWGVPHRTDGEGRLIHECYECGKQRESILGLGPANELSGIVQQNRMMSGQGKIVDTKN